MNERAVTLSCVPLPLWKYLAAMLLLPSTVSAQEPGQRTDRLSLPSSWEYSAPLIAPEDRAAEPSRAQKDPTLVFHEGRWHVFMTVKLAGRTAIEYRQLETRSRARH